MYFRNFLEEYNNIINNPEYDLPILPFYKWVSAKNQEQINHNKYVLPAYQLYENIVRQQFIKLIDGYYLNRNDDVKKLIR